MWHVPDCIRRSTLCLVNCCCKTNVFAVLSVYNCLRQARLPHVMSGKPRGELGFKVAGDPLEAHRQGRGVAAEAAGDRGRWTRPRPGARRSVCASRCSLLWMLLAAAIHEFPIPPSLPACLPASRTLHGVCLPASLLHPLHVVQTR